MFNLFPVYNPFLLLVLSQLYFTSTTPNKDQQKEQLSCSPAVFVLQPGDVHELRGDRLAACVFHASRKMPREKVGTICFVRTDFYDSGTIL